MRTVKEGKRVKREGDVCTMEILKNSKIEPETYNSARTSKESMEKMDE